MSLPVPAPYDAAASYRNFGQELLRMIQSGQITPERANQLKADVYAATKLGNTAQGQQAMNAAIGAARDALPMKGYDPAAMYRNIGSQLSNAVKSGQMTVQQAQALQAPLFAATKLGNTAPGYAQMNSAYNNAISAIRNASSAQPQGGLTQAQQPQSPVTQPQEIVVTGQRMPEIVAPPPPPMPQPPEREVIGQRSPIPGVHGGDTRIFAPTTPPPMLDTPENIQRMPNSQGLMGIGGMLSKFAEQFRNAESMPKSYTSAPRQLTQEEILGITSMPQRPQGVGMAPQMPSAPPQAPLFDRNASLKQLNETFGNLRNTYGEDALRSAGLTPSVFQGFQKTMRELQLNNNSTQDQHTAALQNAYNTMNSFTNNLTPRQLPAPPQGVGMAPQMPPQAAVAQPASAPKGMAMGGLLRKYYGGGMC